MEWLQRSQFGVERVRFVSLVGSLPMNGRWKCTAKVPVGTLAYRVLMVFTSGVSGPKITE